MSQGYWGAVWHQFKKNRLAMAGLVVVSILFLLALLAPLLAGSRPYIYIRETKTYFPLFKDYTRVPGRRSAEGEI
jgi:ABC-type microcin C transport system permease subunit YejE